MGRIIKSALIFSCIFWHLTAIAKVKPVTSHFIMPTEVLTTVDGSQEVRYGLPCGAVFKGYLLTSASEIGAVIERSPIACSALPTIVTAKLALTTFPVKAVKANEAKRIKLAPTLTVDWVKAGSSASAAELVITYEGGCRALAGAVLMSDGQVAMAELTQPDADQHCVKSFKSRRYKLRKHEYRPYNPANDGIVLRVVPGRVRDGSVEFLRNCNEAPIGMTLTTGELPMGIGVLVAEYSSYKCSVSPSMSSLAVPTSVALPGEGDIVPLTGSFAVAVRDLRPVFKITKSVDRHNGKVISNCGKSTLVYSEDSYQNLAIGNIVTPDKHCAKRIESTVLPFINKAYAGVYPLRIKSSY